MKKEKWVGLILSTSVVVAQMGIAAPAPGQEAKGLRVTSEQTAT